MGATYRTRRGDEDMGLFDVITDTIEFARAVNKDIVPGKDGINLSKLNDRSLLTLYDMYANNFRDEKNAAIILRELQRRGIR